MGYCTCVCKFDEAEDDVIQWCATHKFVLDNAVKAEREACAQIVEGGPQKSSTMCNSIVVAKQIRART